MLYNYIFVCYLLFSWVLWCYLSTVLLVRVCWVYEWQVWEMCCARRGWWVRIQVWVSVRDTCLYMGLVRNTLLQFKMVETSLFSCHSMASKWANHLDLQKICIQLILVYIAPACFIHVGQLPAFGGLFHTVPHVWACTSPTAGDGHLPPTACTARAHTDHTS